MLVIKIETCIYLDQHYQGKGRVLLHKFLPVKPLYLVS